ncbi:DUF3040 domain-containing protein [Nonomuraea spiralis]|uniref:DUF3040 domain-containing protein n=1 Tax=Nonomuraea spiralis TaxID=46182 RepID=A0ABV5I9R3_9ACTN|nr:MULTISPECIES: DUF3040 domain-containing protein [Nonomuraea]RSN02659.1 hypothetical protein DMB42_36910 [Nonomuraea sp. WAC 01424]GGT06288.1 hypothetical protein GCM10010176_058350 [Nonomuraea spiralis]
MAWSQDEERMLAQIEQHLVDDDPRLVARLESFNERARRSEARAKGQPGARRRPRRSTVIIVISWVLIATLVATLLIMVLQHEAATAVALAASR